MQIWEARSLVVLLEVELDYLSVCVCVCVGVCVFMCELGGGKRRNPSWGDIPVRLNPAVSTLPSAHSCHHFVCCALRLEVCPRFFRH